MTTMKEKLSPPPIENKVMEAAFAALGQGDYHSGARLLLETEASGNPLVQYNLGVLYEEGLGLDRDIQRAIVYYRRAAENGFAPAQLRYAQFLLHGENIPADRVAAEQWYIAAAEQGNAIAQYSLAVMLLDRKDDSVAHERGLSWLLLAAEKGNEEAQYTLGINYFHGGGLAQDYAKAGLYLSSSAEAGRADAQYYLAILNLEGWGRSADPAEAWKWLQLAAAGGCVLAEEGIKSVQSTLTPATRVEGDRRAAEWSAKRQTSNGQDR